MSLEEQLRSVGYYNLVSQDNGRKEGANVKARLDRGFGNSQLLHQWGGFMVHHLVAFSSDHQPILMVADSRAQQMANKPREPRRFFFEKA